MKKIKIVFTSNFFSVTAMAEYVVRALRRRNDIELFTIGPYYGVNMPWGAVSVVPDKYIFKPDVCFPSSGIGSETAVEMAETRLPDGFIPDVWLTVDSGYRFVGKPKNGINVVSYSDPHVLRDWYNQRKDQYDYRFCSQTPYSLPDEYYLPYAADPEWHNPNGNTIKEYDVCIIGNYYQPRMDLMKILRESGLRTYFQLGVAKEDAREIMNKSIISVNWSSLNDLTARVFETLGTGIVLLANRVKDIELFEEGKEYFGFDNMQEAVSKVKYILDNPEEAKQVAENGRKAIVERSHGWDDRIETLLKTIGVA